MVMLGVARFVLGCMGFIEETGPASGMYLWALPLLKHSFLFLLRKLKYNNRLCKKVEENGSDEEEEEGPPQRR